MATFQDVILAIPGLTHYYPLNEDARDVVGGLDGIIHGNVTFDGKHAKFDGESWIELPDRDEFSAAGNASKELSILVYQTVDDWTRESHNNEYIHWMGKGRSGAHEWVFRYYKEGGGGEAPDRPHRTSYYNFNPDGGLGTGSYFQDPDGNGVERVIVGMIWGNAGNGGKTQMWKNGELRDTDMLSDYDVYPENTNSIVGLGSRGDDTGWLVGRLRRVAFFNRKLTEAEIKSLYDARSYEEGSGSGGGGGDGGGGGSETPAPPSNVDIIVGGESLAVDGFNVQRSSNQLVVYTAAYGAKTNTNEWGAEIKIEGGKVTKILDQQSVPVGEHNLDIAPTGYVVSGHGTARTFLLDNAVVGGRAGFTEIALPEPPPDGGGGGGGGCDTSAVDAAYIDAKAALAELTTAMTALEDAIGNLG